MREKQFIIENMTIIVNLPCDKDKDKDNESVDFSNVSFEKCPSSDDYVVRKYKWYRKYIDPFTIYQAMLGALMGIVFSLFFL